MLYEMLQDKSLDKWNLIWQRAAWPQAAWLHYIEIANLGYKKVQLLQHILLHKADAILGAKTPENY
jgi:hypothetical protein